MASAGAASSGADDPPAAEGRRLARAAMEAKDFDAAIGHLDRDLVGAPNDVDLLIDRAVAFDKRGDTARALADLARAIELDPKNVRAYVWRGKVRFESDQSGSLADCDVALRLDPGNAEALGGRGRLRALRRDFAGAAEDFEAVVARGKANREDRMYLGMVRLALGDGARAVQQYSLLVAESPDDPMVLTLRGMAHMAAGDSERSLLDAEHALRLAPGAEQPNNLRRLVLLRLGRGDEVRRELDERVAILPDDPEGLHLRGLARADGDDLAGSVADLDRAIQLRPRDDAMHLDRAAIEWYRGVHDRALADYALVAGADPGLCPAEVKAVGLRGCAWIRATCPDARLRDGAKALAEATRARDLDSRPSARGLQVLAAAQAEVGDIAAALATLDAADRLGDGGPAAFRVTVVGLTMGIVPNLPPRRPEPGPPLGDRMRAAFRAGRPFRDAGGGPR